MTDRLIILFKKGVFSNMLKIFSDPNPHTLEKTVNSWVKENFPLEVISMSYTHDQEKTYSVALYYNKIVIDW